VELDSARLSSRACPGRSACFASSSPTRLPTSSRTNARRSCATDAASKRQRHRRCRASRALMSPVQVTRAPAATTHASATPRAAWHAVETPTKGRP
jgi:hypothetical protein